MRVIQASENISKGDAISHYIFLISDLLGELGIQNEILSIHVDERVERTILTPESYEMQEGDVILFHASIGGKMFDYLSSLQCKRIMVYHNMTPSAYFKGFDDHIANLLEQGKEQLVQAKAWINKAYGVSEFNVQCLRELGYTDVEKIPYAISFEDFDKANNVRLVKKMKTPHIFKMIFYGRVAPHKCQHDLIKLLAFYRKFYNKHAELSIMGSFNKEEQYYLALEALIQELHLSGAVHIQGHVPYTELVSSIHAADAFVCMSEHEGLLVPILECFHAGIPVVAYGAGAIPETMGNAGICLSEKSFKEAAKALHRLETEQEYRNSIIEQQQDRARDFDPTHLREALQTLLSSLQL